MTFKPRFKLKRIRARGHLGEKVYHHLKEAIVAADLAPGTWLQEEQLTKALGISRTPLREAFNRLQSDGLIIIKPRQGAFVADHTAAEMEDLFEVREVIETNFFLRSAEVFPAEELRRFRALFEAAVVDLAQAEADETAWDKARRRYLAVDRSFHDALILATGNSYWVRIYYNIRDMVEIYGHQVSVIPDGLRLIIDEHSAIIEALLAGRAEEARRLMAEHIRHVYDRVSQKRPVSPAGRDHEER